MSNNTLTTIYTADVIDVDTVRKRSGADFTTWSAEGSWKGESEASRIWQYTGGRGPLTTKYLVEVIADEARLAGESAILVTRQEVGTELIELQQPDEFSNLRTDHLNSGGEIGRA